MWGTKTFNSSTWMGKGGWVGFSLMGIQGLRQQGWQIDIDPAFRFQFVTPDEWYAGLDDSSGEDWFNLELGIRIEGKPFNLLPSLALFDEKKSSAKLSKDDLQMLFEPLG